MCFRWYFQDAPYYPWLDTFDPEMSLTAEDMDNLAKWGFNAVRLYIAWPGVNPAANTVNHTYLDIVEKIVNDLGSRGIYTILDAHQVLQPHSWCCGISVSRSGVELARMPSRRHTPTRRC